MLFALRQRRGDDRHLEAVGEIVVQIEDKLRRSADPYIGDDVEDAWPMPQPDALLRGDLIDRRPQQAKRLSRVGEIGSCIEPLDPASMAITDQTLAATPRLGKPSGRGRHIGQRRGRA